MIPRSLVAVGLVAVCIALGSALPVPAAHVRVVADPVVAAPGPVTPGCHETKFGYSCFYGPLDVGANGIQDVAPFPAPDEEGYITNARATVVTADNEPVSVHSVHLHHAVWVNTEEDDTTCAGGPWSGERFFATGKERTPMNLPAGHGYHWSNAGGDGSGWWNVFHLDPMHGDGENNIFIRLRLGFTTDPTITPVLPIWLDVNGSCTKNLTFDVPKSDDGKRFRIRSDKITLPVSGRMIGSAGHLHDGGLWLKLRNLTRDEDVFTSEAVYGSNMGKWFLAKMTSFFGLPGKEINPGDELKVTAVYNTSRNWNEAMGIYQGMLIPD